MGDVTAALTALVDPEDILEYVEPAAANFEEIQNRRSTPLDAQFAELTIGRDLTPKNSGTRFACIF